MDIEPEFTNTQQLAIDFLFDNHTKEVLLAAELGAVKASAEVLI